MPSNYIIGSDTDDESQILQQISVARKELERMDQEIQRQERVYRVHEGALDGVQSHLANLGFNKLA